jgi:DNA-binding NtrC family response regulator
MEIVLYYTQIILLCRKIMYKIIIVEDDITIARTLKEHLSKWNYNVIYVTDFNNIMEKFE